MQVGFFARPRHKPTHTHTLSECIADTLASRAPHDMRLEIADTVKQWKSRWLKIML